MSSTPFVASAFTLAFLLLATPKASAQCGGYGAYGGGAWIGGGVAYSGWGHQTGWSSHGWTSYRGHYGHAPPHARPGSYWRRHGHRAGHGH